METLVANASHALGSARIDLGDARPAGERALQLRGLMTRRLIASVTELCDVMSRALGEDYADVPQRLRTVGRVAPAVFGQHEALKTSLADGDADGAVAVLRWMRTEPTSALTGGHHRITGDVEQDWVRAALDHLQGSAEADVAPGYVQVKPLTTVGLAKATEQLEEALELLSRIEPEMYLELKEFVTDLVVFQGENITGASSVSFFGAILLHDAYGNQPPVAYYLDHLVHEASHHHVYCALLEDPLLLNDPEERFSSPIRKDARPMLGVFHGLFVLGRVVRTFRRAADAGVNSSFARLLPARERAFAAALDTIERSARLTRTGRGMVDTLVDGLSGD